MTRIDNTDESRCPRPREATRSTRGCQQVSKISRQPHSFFDPLTSHFMIFRKQSSVVFPLISSRSLWIFFTLFLATSSLYSESLPATKNEAPWRDASVFLFNDAYSGFTKSQESSEPMNRLGKAATLLNTQPRTTENIAAAREILLDLSKNQPQNSTLGNLSQFLLARIDENYLTPPQNDEAKSRYLEIVKSKTGVPLLELSASRLVALTTFASDKASDNLAALSTLEPLANFLSTPEGIREFHLAMGLAILENEGDPNLILDHLIKAETIGFRRKENVIQNWLVIGRLGEKIGNKNLAAKYYQKFIDHFPNDPKTFGIKHRLTSLTQNGTN